MLAEKKSSVLPYFLLALAFFVKPIVSGIPGGDGNVAFLGFLLIFFVYGIWAKSHFTNYAITREVLVYLLILIVSQTAVILISSNKFDGLAGVPSLPSAIFSLINPILTMILVYEVARANITKVEDLKNYYRGVILFLIFFLFLVLLPQIYAVFKYNIDTYLNLIGRFFEARHTGRNDFYANGSYVTTLRRINGFSEEAGFFAVQVAVCFIPILLTSIFYDLKLFSKNHRWVDRIVYWTLFFALIITLFFAKTTTGILVIALSSLVLIILSIVRRPKISLVVLIILGSLGYLAYAGLPVVHNILDTYLLGKQGTENRFENTVALVHVFLRHPIFGVGFGMSSPYVMNLISLPKADNLEFLYYFNSQGFAVQSEFTYLMAALGLVGIVPILIYVIHKYIQSVTILWSRHNQYIKASVLAFIIGSFFYLIFSFFSFAYLNIFYYLTFAVLLQAFRMKTSG